MIRARMRSGVSWHDVCILNLSRRGLGIQAAEPPQRGAYVEIRRGKHVILGLAASALGLTIVATVEQALARPIAQVRAALDGQAARP